MLDAVLEGAALSAPARPKLFAGSDEAEPSNSVFGIQNRETSIQNPA